MTRKTRGVLPLLIVLVVQLAISAISRNLGPVAISDDDYARVVIAQRFAETPTLDPSGSSWLPLPFYLTGGGMMLLGASLEIARLLSFVFAMAAAGLLYSSGRLLGASRILAACGAIAAAALPTAARLSGATVPEYPTAALLVFATAALAAPPRPIRMSGLSLATWPPLLGAGAAFAATACRYEAWPVALGFSAIAATRALRSRFASSAAGCLRAAGSVPDSTGRSINRSGRDPAKPTWLADLVVSALAPSFIILWLLHGLAQHGDPLFFVSRVVDYKKSLGAASSASFEHLWQGYPRRLVLQEPQVLGLLGAGAFSWYFRGGSQPRSWRWPPLLLLPLLLVITLVLGDLRGGAPTHHPGRPLLFVWLLAVVVGFRLATPLLMPPRTKPQLMGAIGCIIAGAGLSNLRITPQAFAQRSAEETLGKALRQYPGEKVVLSTPDYGYFAIQAAAGSPQRFSVASRNDPRDPAPQKPARRLALERAAQQQARFIVGARNWQLLGFHLEKSAGSLGVFVRQGAH